MMTPAQLKAFVDANLPDNMAEAIQPVNARDTFHQFADAMPLVAPGSATPQRLAVHQPAAPINITTSTTTLTNISTGFDLTSYSGMTVKFLFADQLTGIAWQFVEMDVDEAVQAFNDGLVIDQYFNIFDNDWVRVELVDPVNGVIGLRDTGRDFQYVRSELWVNAQQISERIDVLDTGGAFITVGVAPQNIGAPNPLLEGIVDGDVAVITYGDGTASQGVFIDGKAVANRESGLAVAVDIVGDQARAFMEAGGASGVDKVTILSRMTVFGTAPFNYTPRDITDWDLEADTGFVHNTATGVIANGPAGWGNFNRGEIRKIDNYVVQTIWDRNTPGRTAHRIIINDVIQDAANGNNGWQVHVPINITNIATAAAGTSLQYNGDGTFTLV